MTRSACYVVASGEIRRGLGFGSNLAAPQRKQPNCWRQTVEHARPPEGERDPSFGVPTLTHPPNRPPLRGPRSASDTSSRRSLRACDSHGTTSRRRSGRVTHTTRLPEVAQRVDHNGADPRTRRPRPRIRHDCGAGDCRWTPSGATATTRSSPALRSPSSRTRCWQGRGRAEGLALARLGVAAHPDDVRRAHRDRRPDHRLLRASARRAEWGRSGLGGLVNDVSEPIRVDCERGPSSAASPALLLVSDFLVLARRALRRPRRPRRLGRVFGVPFTGGVGLVACSWASVLVGAPVAVPTCSIGVAVIAVGGHALRRLLLDRGSEPASSAGCTRVRIAGSRSSRPDRFAG